MAKIFYGVSGEGRGHATRAQAIIEMLCKNHHIVIYASGLAYDFLAPIYRYHTTVEIRRIPGLHFHYSPTQRLNYWKTSKMAFSYLAEMPKQVQRVQRAMEKENPALVITDFEPLLPRAANRCGIPFLSINHQHFLLSYDLYSLPIWIRSHAALMAQVVRAYHTGQAETVVSSFYFPPLKRGFEDVKQIGVLIRRELLEAQRKNGSHVVVYLRRFASAALYNALQNCGCDIRIYGLGARPSRGSLHFREVNRQGFLEDLATSRALVSTAGNQLVGEALFLEKPVLVMPEPGNYEQEINAHFLTQSGAGDSINMETLTSNSIRNFLDRSDHYRSRINHQSLYGNPKALSIICSHLPEQRSKMHSPNQHPLTEVSS